MPSDDSQIETYSLPNDFIIKPDECFNRWESNFFPKCMISKLTCPALLARNLSIVSMCINEKFLHWNLESKVFRILSKKYCEEEISTSIRLVPWTEDMSFYQINSLNSQNPIEYSLYFYKDNSLKLFQNNIKLEFCMWDRVSSVFWDKYRCILLIVQNALGFNTKELKSDSIPFDTDNELVVRSFNLLEKILGPEKLDKCTSTSKQKLFENLKLRIDRGYAELKNSTDRVENMNLLINNSTNLLFDILGKQYKDVLKLHAIFYSFSVTEENICLGIEFSTKMYSLIFISMFI